MFWLLVASLIWGFAFGLIKGRTAHLDPFFLAAVRSLLAFLSVGLIAGFIRRQFWPNWQAVLAGALQLGLMYVPYLISFRYLQGFEVALFTLTTPLFVLLVADWREQTFRRRYLVAAACALAGGLVVAWRPILADFSSVLKGAAWVQLANFLFALGQEFVVRRGSANSEVRLDLFSYFLGATGASGLVLLGAIGIRGLPSWGITQTDVPILLWLGVASTGLGFALWNYGALRVSRAELAVAADMKLPLAVAISLFFFGEPASLPLLLIGGGLLFLASRVAKAAV